jgi:hypothetical protein
MINRKNTSDVVATWRNFLSGKTQKSSSRQLNEVMGDDDMGDEIMDTVGSEISAVERNECLKAIISDLADCGWEQDRIDVLIAVLDDKATDDQICMIANGLDEAPSVDEKNYRKDMDNNSF